MSVPATKDEFKRYCLRELGAPVLTVNVDDDQVDDRVDYALKKYAEYHYDATDKIYFKQQLERRHFPDSINHVSIVSGNCANAGVKYANGEPLVFTSVTDNALSLTPDTAVGTISTDANGNIISVTLTGWGRGYALPPTVTVNSAVGVGASLACELGGYIDIPDNIIGVVSIFDLSSTMISQDMFSIQYQIALNDLWSLSTYSMVPYYLTISQLSLIQQLLVGSQPIRYTRHRHRMYIDMDWSRLIVGNYIVGTCYQAISPNEFPAIWSDIWLQRYATALIKKQWGNNTKKFGNMMLPGGTVFTGKGMYDEAVDELAKLEYSLINDFSIPLEYFVG